MAVKLDLIDGSSGKKTVNGWEEIERIATVTGATGSGHTKIITLQRLAECLRLVTCTPACEIASFMK